MKVEPLSIDIVGLVGACSYALDCIEAELVNVKNKHGKRVAYISVCMAEYWSIKSDALQDLAMCALLHDNAPKPNIFRKNYKNHSDVYIKNNLSEKKKHLHCIYGEKISQNFRLKQMFQTLYYITMSMRMEPVHFKKDMAGNSIVCKDNSFG